jgi:hypothetical protein
MAGMRSWFWLRALGALSAAGCHDLFDGVFPYVCEDGGGAALTRLPARLSETGLYQDVRRDVLAADVLPFRPRFELWSDGATKRRWLRLPPGASIDATDPDDWRFPVGTKVWKEFARGDVRIETRLLEKVGPGDRDWVGQSYLWQQRRDGDREAWAAPGGHVDAAGTTHDLPAAGECPACHGGRRSFVLGVSAIQLAYDAAPGQIDLADLMAAGRLTGVVPPQLALPGDDDARAALGYLHANCGHCHSAGARADRPCFVPDNALDFWLRTSRLSSVEVTTAYTTAVGDAIRPGDPRGSAIVGHMSTTDLFARMPPLGTRQVDVEALAVIQRWIAALR